VGVSAGAIVGGLRAAGRVVAPGFTGLFLEPPAGRWTNLCMTGRRFVDGKRAFEEEPQSPNGRDSALPCLADSLSLFCLAVQLRNLSSFCQSVVFQARIPRWGRSIGAYLEFVLSSFSKLDPCFQ
jgi:hypothetical protein